MRQKNNKKIFIDTGNNKELAYIGKENIFSQFYYYTVGYYNTAKILIEHTLNLPNTSSEYAKEEELRLCVAPACFLYRQYLELTLKDIYIQYSEDSEDAKKRMIKNTSHDLKKIWEYAKPLIGKAVKGMDSDINTYAMIESYILEFASEDSTSFKYRYPITKDLNFIFPQERKINIRNLMECMDEVEEFLAGRGLLAWLDMYKLRREYEKHINYALEYSKQDKYQEALNQYQEALIWIKKWSEDHTDIVFITYEMAQIYFKIENFDNSLLLYHQCADLYEKIKKIKDIPFTLDSIYNLIGLIYKIQRKYYNALEYYSKPLENSMVTDNDKNDSYTSLARIYYKMNDKSKAEVFYKKAINIRISIFGENHENTIFLRNEIINKF